MVPRLLGWDRKRATQRGVELLELIGLSEELGKRYPSQLSGDSGSASAWPVPSPPTRR